MKNLSLLKKYKILINKIMSRIDSVKEPYLMVLDSL